MKLLVCGGRNFTDQEALFNLLDTIHTTTPITLIIEGGARGADIMGRAWAILNEVEYKTFKPDWDKYGKSAGFKRNTEMLDFGPDAVLATPGGNGTADTVRKATSRNIKVIQLGRPYPA